MLLETPFAYFFSRGENSRRLIAITEVTINCAEDRIHGIGECEY